MPDGYDELAADYEWMFSDEMLVDGAAILQPATSRLLSQLRPGALVLDGACGIGVDAAVLARRGLNMWAADGSAAMVERARQRFASEHLDIPVLAARWDQLPSLTETRFDAVLCIGNSLVHAAGRDRMAGALQGLTGMLRPGGRLAIDSRNWEKLHADRPRVQVADRAVVRGGRRCVVLYVWDIPDRFEAEHVATLVFAFDDGEVVCSHQHCITFRPFTVEQLRERMLGAGLLEIDNDVDRGSDRYSVVAKVGTNE